METETPAATSNVLKIVEYVDDNRFMNPEEVLELALKDYKEDPSYDKILIITLNRDSSSYEFGYYAANISTSEIAALCGVVQARSYKDLMGE